MARNKTGLVYLRLPAFAQAGDIVPVQVKMKHPMDVGWSEEGNRLNPLNPVGRLQTLKCLFNGREVLYADIGDGLSADPYVSFTLRLHESGTLEARWEDENGIVGVISRFIRIIPTPYRTPSAATREPLS